MVTTPTEPTRHILTPNLTQKKPIPDTSNKDSPKQRLISFSNMRRIKELQGTINIQRGPHEKPFLAQIRRNLIPPSTKDSSTKMLNRTRQIAQKGQTRSIPCQFLRIPTKPNHSRTLKKQMNRTMTRSTLSSTLQQTINTKNLPRTISQIPPKHTKTKPNNTKGRITT